MKRRVCIGTSSFGSYDERPLDLMREEDLTWDLNPRGRRLEGPELVEFAWEAVGLIAGNEPLDESTLPYLKRLRVISRCGVGLDNVDLDVATRCGIRVFNTPSAPTPAVAELTLSVTLSLLRHTSWMDRDLRAGSWKKRMGHLLRGKRVGIIGFGDIGQEVARLFQVLGCSLGYADPREIDSDLPARRLGLRELLEWADIVSVHISGGGREGPLIGEFELGHMRQGAWLVNLSRGGVVDEDALAASLSSGRLRGAAIDVFGEEPYSGPLTGYDNVVLTPHVGSYGLEARVDMEIQAVRNLIEGLRIWDEA